MDNSKKNPASFALSFGLILGGVNVIYSLMLYSLDMHYQNEIETSLISYAFLIGIIFYGILQFKRNNDGFLSLSEGLKTGVGIALISSIVISIYVVILMQEIDPEFMDKSIEFQKQKLLQKDPEISVENVNKMFDAQKEFSGPFIISGFIIVFNLFFGFIISMIGALILKKSKPE
jgi:hypothetical protein